MLRLDTHSFGWQSGFLRYADHRFYRHVLIEKALSAPWGGGLWNWGKALFNVFAYLGWRISAKPAGGPAVPTKIRLFEKAFPCRFWGESVLAAGGEALPLDKTDYV